MSEQRRWKKGRRIAAWLSQSIGRWTIVLAIVSAVIAAVAFWLVWMSLFRGDSCEGIPPTYKEDYGCADEKSLFENVVGSIFVFMAGNAVAWVSCAVAYVRHQRQLKLNAVLNAPRLQGWRNWLAERRIRAAEYEQVAPVLMAWMDGTEHLLIQRLGAAFLRRIGYAAALLGILAVWVGMRLVQLESPTDYATGIVWATAAPFLLVGAALCIIPGWSLGLWAQRGLTNQKQRVDALEAEVLEGMKRRAT